MPTNEVVDKRYIFQQDVFKPDHELPSMPLEEFGEMERKRMIANTAYFI